ncbi:MAG: dihydrodipicolinate synthase family protein [Caldilineaceae bacterium]|nr:dihydrodipicolinate synthase family protein [Caldilineaceae bacterium]
MTVHPLRAALSGPIASVHTPFLQDGEIDYPSLRRMVDFAVEGQAAALMLTFGNSLYSLLSDAEVMDVTRVVVAQAARRVPVVAADRAWATTQTVDFARACRDLGADVLMVLPPDWAGSCTVDTLVEHYAAVAAELPVMVVTNLFAQSQPRGLATSTRLRDEVPGVVAVKDDVCGVFGRKLATLVGSSWAVLAGGQKQNHFDAWPYGCTGYLSTFSVFAPQIAQRYWQAIQREDRAAAVAVIQEFDMPFFDQIIPLPGGFDAGIHATLEIFGLAQRWRRKPYHSLGDVDVERLRLFFREKGLVTGDL